MSRFFFDCFDGERHVVDDYGIDLDTEAEVRVHADDLAQSLLADSFPVADPRSVNVTVTVTVRTSSGAVVSMTHCSLSAFWMNDWSLAVPAQNAM